MRRFLILTAVFLLASLSCAGLIYISKSYQFYQQIIPMLLVIDILLASRLKNNQPNSLSARKLFVLFISSLLIQVIVISSGGFYSPLLILLHIYTLGAIFVLSSSSPIVFLTFSLGVLIFHISFDRNLYQFFQNDPWTVAIYALSIIIVIPLALYLSRSNMLKDRFTNLLKDYINMSEKKQKSILTALSNMVIVTDKNLNIVSVNIAVERLLRTSINQIEGKPIFDFLVLKNSDGTNVTYEELPVKEALRDKATHFAEGLFFESKSQTIPQAVTLQVRPLTNQSGEVTQVVFVLTDPLIKIGFNTHPSIKEAISRRDKLLELLTGPGIIDEKTARINILLITHIEADILTVQEMEDHPLQEVIGFTDMVIFINQILSSKKYFYQVIGSVPQFSYEDTDRTEAAFLELQKSPTDSLNSSKYSVPIDTYLFKVILEKILDLCVFLTSGVPGASVKVNLSLDLDKNIVLEVIFPSMDLKDADLVNLFLKDYPGISTGQLQKSSGLEGYIAGKISRTIQNIPEIKINPYNKTISIKFSIPKQPKIHYQTSF